MTLNLTPNELRGYRLKADWHSINVVSVKIHGTGSKHAGEEYETTLAYCRTVESAAAWLFQHVMKVQGELTQEELARVDKSVADVKGLLAAIEKAQAHTLVAVREFTEVLKAANLSERAACKLLLSRDPQASEDEA